MNTRTCNCDSIPKTLVNNGGLKLLIFIAICILCFVRWTSILWYQCPMPRKRNHALSLNTLNNLLFKNFHFACSYWLAGKHKIFSAISCSRIFHLACDSWLVGIKKSEKSKMVYLKSWPLCKCVNYNWRVRRPRDGRRFPFDRHDDLNTMTTT
jgi:hypothetical protein